MIQHIFCFEPRTLDVPAIRKLMAQGFGFTPAWIDVDGQESRYQKDSLHDDFRFSNLTVSEEKDALDGPSFSVASIEAWEMQCLYWTTENLSLDINPAIGLLDQLACLSGFNAGYTHDADDIYWQSERSLSNYRLEGRSTDGLVLTKSSNGEVQVDISANPGRQHLVSGQWVQSAWRMWFGKKAISLLTDGGRLAFPNMKLCRELPCGALFFQLYDDLANYQTEEARFMQKAFRESTHMDALETTAGRI